MGAQKLDLEEIQYLSYIPKELAQFWQAYFSNLSVSLGKLFYKPYYFFSFFLIFI